MKYLNIVSVFPAVTETFVYREIRTAQRMGCEVVIAQLRPGGAPHSEFDDLRPSLIRSPLLSLSSLLGTVRLAATKPRLFIHYAGLVLSGFPRMGSVIKLSYILLVSMALAHRLRSAGIRHIRGHHLHSEAVAAMFLSGWLDVPFSFTCHTVKTYYPDGIIRRVIHDATFILANIVQVKRFLISRGAGNSQVQLVRNGVSLTEFRLRPAGFQANPPTILAVGRLDCKKGFHILLSACALLRDEGLHFRCVIVGDGDERGELEGRRKSLGLEGRVDFMGSLSFEEVQRWYECATLLAVPSVVAPDGSTDGMPTVIIEALARGVPVVGSATAGIPEVIQNGVNGFVVAPGSVRELAGRIRELLSDPDMRRKFALEGRKTAERDFDLDRNVGQLVRLMFERADDAIPAAPLPGIVPAARDLENHHA